MADRFVEEAKNNMSALERLFKGLPGISGYVDKEMRRNADWRLRQTIADELVKQKRALFEIQQRLLQAGGLKWLDDVDRGVQKLQILIDRVKTASAGYAGLFDAVKIREKELNALHSFDVALAGRVVVLENAVAALSTAVTQGDDLAAPIGQVTETVSELNSMFDKREHVILDPQLLLDNDFVPDVGEDPIPATT